MSQAEAASRVGCSRKRISEFELGLAEPSFVFVASYCAVLGAVLEFVPPEGDHMDF